MKEKDQLETQPIGNPDGQFAVHDTQRLKINCFYNNKFEPCTFTTTESKAMEKHYRQKHYPKAKGVCHG